MKQYTEFIALSSHFSAHFHLIGGPLGSMAYFWAYYYPVFGIGALGSFRVPHNKLLTKRCDPQAGEQSEGLFDLLGINV